jgi:hypothetical protein
MRSGLSGKHYEAACDQIIKFKTRMYSTKCRSNAVRRSRGWLLEPPNIEEQPQKSFQITSEAMVWIRPTAALDCHRAVQSWADLAHGQPALNHRGLSQVAATQAERGYDAYGKPRLQHF